MSRLNGILPLPWHTEETSVAGCLNVISANDEMVCAVVPSATARLICALSEGHLLGAVEEAVHRQTGGRLTIGPGGTSKLGAFSDPQRLDVLAVAARLGMKVDG